jgi:hypothetical protein
VAVDFALSGVTDDGYTGELTVSNMGSKLKGWSLRVPVGGDVTGADGAAWVQEGDILVLSSTHALRAHEQILISFAADGDPTLPNSCELSGGSCRLNVTDGIGPQLELDA